MHILSLITISVGAAVAWRVFADPTVNVEVAALSCVGMIGCSLWMLMHH
jgi:hypothetical protein